MLKSAAAGLVDHVLARQGIEFWYDVVAGFAADEQAAEGTRGADSESRGVVGAAVQLAGGERGEVGSVAFARVIDWEIVGAEGGEKGLEAGDDGADGGDVVALVLEVAFGGAD